MNLRTKLFLMIGIFASLTAVHAASFDCTKASSPTEKMICQNPKISKLDDRLSEVYKEARKADASIVEEQRAWLKEARACKDEKCLENTYGIRVEALENRLAKLEQNKNQGTPQSEANQSLIALFQSGGAWVADESVTQSNLSCSALLANSNLGLSFEKYEPNQMTIQTRLGGRHPNKNNPDVQRMFTSDIRVMIRVESLKVSGNKVTFDRFVTTRQGAVMGETYELDTGDKVIRMLKAHTCQNCDEAQLKIFQSRKSGGSLPRYWCNG
jgi:hypothetical protein